MDSLDVDSFFTNIPLRETINICTNLLYNDVDVIVGINKSEFENLLSLANQEFYLTIFFTNKRRMWPWDGPYNLLWEMLFCCFMKWNDLNSALANLNQFFTEDMLMILLFYLNQPSSSQNLKQISIHVILICLFHLNNKIMISCHFKT